MKPWRWSWRDFFIGLLGTAAGLRWFGCGTTAAIFWGILGGICMAVEEHKGLILPRRLDRERRS